MDVNVGKETEANRDQPILPDKPNFEQKAYALINKFGLRDGILQIDQVIGRAGEFIKQHDLPEAFTDDETNLSLILGCSQKLVESADSYHKARVKNLAKRLVSPSVQKGILDEEELWGSGSDRGGLDDDKVKEYVASKSDPEATSQFKEKYKSEIDRCKEAWKSKRYDLDVQVHIVDDLPGEFQKQTRSQAYILPPNREKLSDPNYRPTVELVMLKGHSAESTELIRHELYHIEDFFDSQRRGYQHGIFELLDEIHTEYTVGNYTPDNSRDPSKTSGYQSAKRLWDKLSFLGDVDFNLIADRKRTLDTIVEKFGFEGLVDFALAYARSGGKVRTFETFYSNPERAVLAMLVNRDKLNLLKGYKTGQADIDVATIQEGVANLASYMTPTEESWSPSYKPLYELVPTQYGEFFAAKPVEDGIFSRVDNEKMKQIINSYTQALALVELSSQGVPLVTPEVYTQVIEAITSVPIQRRDLHFTPENVIERMRGLYIDCFSNEDDFRREQARSLCQVPIL